MTAGSNSKDITLTESEREVLGLAFRREAMTQGQIAEVTGLTQQSASRIVKRLEQAGLLVEGEKVATGKRGYPSANFSLNPDAAYAFGLSLSHEGVALSLVNFAGELITEDRHDFSSMDQRTVLDWLALRVPALTEAHLSGEFTIAGLGVAVAGSHIGHGEGAGYNTPYELEAWAGVDIAGIISNHLGLPVWTDNNGNLAAFAEAKVGVGRRVDSFAYLYISSGVGGGVVLDGELWRGKYGNAGEFAGGLPPNIYPFPNLELLRQLAVGHGENLPSVSMLIRRFDPRWRANEEWIARVRDSVSIIASNATAILDVDLIVLGGHIPRELAEMLIPRIDLYDQQRRAVARPKARIVPAETVGDAAALGAAILPFQQVYFRVPGEPVLRTTAV